MCFWVLSGAFGCFWVFKDVSRGHKAKQRREDQGLKGKRGEQRAELRKTAEKGRDEAEQRENRGRRAET